MARKRIKSELAVVFGPEPDFKKVKVTKKNYNSVLIAALQWYGQYGGADDANSRRSFHKSWLNEWAEANGVKKGTYSLPNQGIATWASLARCALKGLKLQKRDKDRLKEAYEKWPPVAPKVVDREALARVAKIKARKKNDEELMPFLTTFDNAIDGIMFDGDKKWDIKVPSLPLNATQKKSLTAGYKAALKEFELLLEGDKEVTEYYGKLPKLVKRRLVKVHKEILEQIKEAGSRGKVARRVVRRKKAKPASAHVKKLKYMVEHKDYHLASIDPEKVVGAQVLYTFETKKRLLKKYTAMGIAGIEVSGTTLKNVAGTQKKIRKPEEQLLGFGSLPRTKAEKVFTSTKAVEKECTGRMNVDTIILRAF